MDKLASPRSITLYDHLTNVVEDGHICMHAQLTLQNVNKECMVQRKVLPMANLRFCSTSPATGRPYWASTRSWCTWGTSALASEKTRRCNFPSPSPLIYDPSLAKERNSRARTKVLNQIKSLTLILSVCLLHRSALSRSLESAYRTKMYSTYKLISASN